MLVFQCKTNISRYKISTLVIFQGNHFPLRFVCLLLFFLSFFSFIFFLWKKKTKGRKKYPCFSSFSSKIMFISCSFTPRRGLFLVPYGEPKEETKLLFFSLLFSKGERNHRGITFGRKKQKEGRKWPNESSKTTVVVYYKSFKLTKGNVK